MNTLVRVLGVFLPLGLFLIFPHDSGWSFVVRWLAAALLGGLLLRSWWATVIMPAEALAAGLLLTAIYSDVSRYGQESGLLGVILLGILPVAVAAAVGTLIGKLVEARRLSHG